jgi:hypothetical protein
MAIKLVRPSPRCRVVFYPKTTNNAQSEGDALFLTSGALSVCASAANAGAIAGVALATLTAAEATAMASAGTKTPVLVDEDGIWSVPVDDSTSFDEGVLCDADSTGQKLDCNGTTYITFQICGGNTTTGHVHIRRWDHNDPGASVS